MRDTTVLLTCTGGVISPSHIHSLKNNPDKRPIKIIGTDTTVPCIGQCFADKFYQVPMGTAPDYKDTILDICSKESVDVIFPASHEEAMTLAKNSKVFKKNGIVIAISKYDVLDKTFNKKNAYQTLKDNGLPCPEFRAVKNLSEFEAASAELGIGKNKIVMKPVISRGGRGARILTKESLVSHLLNDKPGYLETNYDETIRTLSSIEKQLFPELILMEYLSGQIYSVDFLAKNGKALIIVPKIRIFGNASQTIVGAVKKNKHIEEMIGKISQVFGFDYNINIELACNNDGIPLPFDFNPRIAASTAFCSAAGANLIYYALKMALGEEVPEVKVKDNVIMIRYFKEQYLYPDEGVLHV
jgi:carbamoyl-phosphate synthase large subunit